MTQMKQYPKSTFKHPSSIVLFNLEDHLPFYNVKGRTIGELLNEKHPFLESALMDLHIFCCDDFTYGTIIDSGFPLSETAKSKQLEKRKRHASDTIEYNKTFTGLSDIQLPNVKLYDSHYNIGFGIHAGQRVDLTIVKSPAQIENMIHTLFWFGLTRKAIQLMISMEPSYIFLTSTWELLEMKYKAAPDYMKEILGDGQDVDNDNSDLEYESEYSGSWASEAEGFSDDDIDSAFDGDPDAYWNID